MPHLWVHASCLPTAASSLRPCNACRCAICAWAWQHVAWTGQRRAGEARCSWPGGYACGCLQTSFTGEASDPHGLLKSERSTEHLQQFVVQPGAVTQLCNTVSICTLPSLYQCSCHRNCIFLRAHMLTPYGSGVLQAIQDKNGANKSLSSTLAKTPTGNHCNRCCCRCDNVRTYSVRL